MEVVDAPHVTSPLSTPIPLSSPRMEVSEQQQVGRHNQVGSVMLYGVPIVSLVIDGIERLCLAQISNTLLKDFSYNEIHNRRVALGITCVQCTPVQLEILRRAGAMPISSRRCGMITKREAERLCKSFLGDNSPPKLPENFAFDVVHECAWGSRGSFVPSRYNSSRAKCIKCFYCSLFFSPNKFVFHSHRIGEGKYVQPDAANFNSWRRHIRLYGDPPQEVVHAWEDVKAMFNGGTRKRLMQAHNQDQSNGRASKQPRLNSSLNKTSSFPSAPIKNLPGSEVGIGGYTPYLGGMPPLGQPYPVPVAQKALDMRQSFVDYLWGSRTGMSSLGLPYPLPWPKRPLPSFPPFSLAGTETLPETQDFSEGVNADRTDLGLRQTSASAFTPVSRPTPPPSPVPTSSPHQGEQKTWPQEENPRERVEASWEEGTAVLPDSSRASDDESVDVEGNEEVVQRITQTTQTQDPQTEEKPFAPALIKSSSSLTPVVPPILPVPQLVTRVGTPPPPSAGSGELSSPTSTKPEKTSPSSLSSSFPPLDSFCLIPEEDPRLRLFLLREVEARRRMEVEMARLKYSYSSHLHPPPTLHHTPLGSAVLPHHPPPHLQIGTKDWLESTSAASSSQ